jgi:hypothetical protein
MLVQCSIFPGKERKKMAGASKNEMLTLAFCFWKHSPVVDEKLPSVRVPPDMLEEFG